MIGKSSVISNCVDGVLFEFAQTETAGRAQARGGREGATKAKESSETKSSKA